MKRTGGKAACQAWNKKMPVLLLYGEDDPVGDAGKGVRRFHAWMKKSGIGDVVFQMIPGARHDLLHEEANGAESVRRCIADWLAGIQGSAEA